MAKAKYKLEIKDVCVGTENTHHIINTSFLYISKIKTENGKVVEKVIAFIPVAQAPIKEYQSIFDIDDQFKVITKQEPFIIYELEDYR